MGENYFPQSGTWTCDPTLKILEAPNYGTSWDHGSRANEDIPPDLSMQPFQSLESAFRTTNTPVEPLYELNDLLQQSNTPNQRYMVPVLHEAGKSSGFMQSVVPTSSAAETPWSMSTTPTEAPAFLYTLQNEQRSLTLLESHSKSNNFDLTRFIQPDLSAVSKTQFETSSVANDNFDSEQKDISSDLDVTMTSPWFLSTVDPSSGAPQTFLSVPEVNLSVPASAPLSNPLKAPLPFDTSQDELMGITLPDSSADIVNSDHTYIYIPRELPSTAYRITKCANCGSLFDMISFKSHICDYNEDHKLINPPVTSKRSSKQSKQTEIEVPPEPESIRLLRENELRYKRILKEELGYDVVTKDVPSNTNCAPIASDVNKRPDLSYECNLCDRKFVHVSGLLRHVEKHAQDLVPSTDLHSNDFHVVIRCVPCGRIFFETSAAFKHFDIHNTESKENEKERDSNALIPYERYLDDILQHLEEDENVSTIGVPTAHAHNRFNYFTFVNLNCVLQCEFCDYIFADMSSLMLHSANHLPQRHFECFSCDVYMNTAREIYLHWQTECVFLREDCKINQATIRRYFACNVCEKKFSALYLLHEHRYQKKHFFPRLNKVRGSLELPCEYCHVRNYTIRDCILHYNQYHSKKTKVDTEPIESPEKERMYLCDICGKSYTQSGHLWQHLRFHLGEKPFVCQEPGCDRKFTIRADLNDHIRKYHTRERPFHCTVCNKRFLTSSVFYQHRLIHSNERRYECDECGRKFHRPDALKNHFRIHTGEKPYACTYCTKNFRQRGDRDKHIRARHSHLDENSRKLLQMHKLQFETAAAVAATKMAEQQQLGYNATGIDYGNESKDFGKVMTMRVDVTKNAKATSTSTSTSKAMQEANEEQGKGSVDIVNVQDVVVIGNIPFPRSLFEPVISGTDHA